MKQTLITLAIGLTSGVLSGAFGIGGGIITTPAIRLILGAPALVAVGTPLPVIFPSALSGALTYARKGLVDVRAGLTLGALGSLAAIVGALGTRLVGGNVVLVATAALIFYTAGDMVLQIVRPPRLGLEAAEEADAADALVHPAEVSAVPSQPRSPMGRLVAIGLAAGFYSGFLGLGGGFVVVPLLTRWLGFPIKRAIATSLLTITILAVPGTVTHALLGHIDWGIALWLAVGVVPGALIGSRITMGSGDRAVRLAFAALLLAVGAWLGYATLFGGPA